MSKITKQEAISELWRRGDLSWKCHSVQKEMYNIFYSSPKNSILVWLLARQSGKTFLLSILALEQALRKSNAIIKMVTDTKLHIKSILEPIFIELLKDCPQELKPEFKTQTFIYYFPNGSQIQLAGTDNKHYEKLRGQKADLVLVDEAGFSNDLDDVVRSVLIPTTTHTGGRIVLASTPPNEADHDFLKFLEEAELNKTLTKKTIYDNPLLNEKDIERISKQIGGVNSEKFRREYLCEIIKDSTTTVIPEFTDELQKEIVKEWPKPPFFDSYVSMDLGGKDLTVVLFGYYDFRADKIIIEDELVFDFKNQDSHLEKLVKDIIKKEEDLWTNILTNEVRKPYLRVSDINYIVTQEIHRLSNYQLNFQTTKKDDNAAAINFLREMLGNKKIIINPKCKTLIRHLKNVRWASSNNKDKFARSPDNGHYDAVDACKYFLRSVVWSKNPYPNSYGSSYRQQDLFVRSPDVFNASSSNKNIEVYKQIFKVKPRK